MDRSKIHEEIHEALPHVPAEAIAAFDAEWHNECDVDWLTEQLAEAWEGEWTDLAEYAEHIAYEAGPLDGNESVGWPFNCIDWEQAGRELVTGGDVWTAEGSLTYVFRNI